MGPSKIHTLIKATTGDFKNRNHQPHRMILLKGKNLIIAFHFTKKEDHKLIMKKENLLCLSRSLKLIIILLIILMNILLKNKNRGN